MNDTVVIKCPKCGMEYLPAEIFVPKAFIGSPEVIKRDTEGNITDYIGTNVDLKEIYTCDRCDTTFNVVADLSFRTDINEEHNFVEEYVTPVKPRFTIDEF